MISLGTHRVAFPKAPSFSGRVNVGRNWSALSAVTRRS